MARRKVCAYSVPVQFFLDIFDERLIESLAVKSKDKESQL
jgi:hypothetical protein